MAAWYWIVPAIFGYDHIWRVGEGTVFELTPWEGGAWNENVAFDFTGNSTGYVPYAGLIIDSADNLYGTTYFGGSNGPALSSR